MLKIHKTLMKKKYLQKMIILVDFLAFFCKFQKKKFQKFQKKFVPDGRKYYYFEKK